ncbi:hypothetical protein E0H59_05430 [Rhizobium leguminosarum bv. viciae]|nr:hypothetical protein E0H59_05430 [Rhizobium leguminosarum bv. viciae]
MRVIVSFIFFLAMVASAHAADQYRCKDFVADFGAISVQDKIGPGSDAKWALAAGFVMGAYFSKTGDDFGGKNDSGLAAFEKAVVAECSAHPEDLVPLTVLRLSASLEPSGALPAKATNTGDYTPISLTDLKLDAKQMQGKKVEVTGVVMIMGDIAMIGESLFSSNKLFVESKKLSRGNRKYLLENCDAGCSITIRGKVATVMLNDGIIADDIVTQ